MAHQLQALKPAPAPTYGPQRTLGGCRPSELWRRAGLSDLTPKSGHLKKRQ